MSKRAAVLLALAVTACASAGRWGHARSYAPAADEKAVVDGARDLDAPMALTQPEKWIGQNVRFFMVVDERGAGPGGAAYLTGKLHTLNEINGCANRYDEETCRVTIKPVGHDTVHVLAKLSGDLDVGPVKVSSGSLLRVVGVISDKTDADDGKLVIQASWVRAWPIGYYAHEGELVQ
ncbi:MAG: hypothetical protein ACHREM_24130 [Polyangiales bacterium]